MKRSVLTAAGIFLCVQVFKSQTSYVWNGATSTAWNVSTNWTPNGIPGGNAGDNVTIVSGSNVCILAANTAINNITVTSGTLDLGASTLSASGNGQFTAGTVRNGTLSISGTATNTAVFNTITFNTNATLLATTGVITVNGGTYGGVVTLNQTGATQSSGSGGATFNSTLSITNSGTSNFRINGNCTYNGPVFLTNSGTGYLLPELNTGSNYNSTVTLNNSASQHIRMAYQGGTSFNGDLIINNTGSGNVLFCEQATATASLTSGKSISIGSSGFSSGSLILSRFTQIGASAQNLALSGTATAVFNNTTTFNGALTLSSPNILISGCIFNGATTLTKTDGTSNNNMSGGNTFNSTLTANYTSTTGTGYWGFANGTADIYNGDVYINNNSLDRIIMGFSSTNNQYNGNLIVTQAGSSAGILLTWSGTSSSLLAAGKTISVGSAGFSVGYLALQGLTQNGSAAINLSLTGTSSIYVGTYAASNPCTFNGSFTVSAPDIYLRGAVFNGAVTLTKTGGGNNHNNGYQNTFNSTCTINQQSSSGYIMLGYNSGDLFNGNIIVTATGSGGINLGYSSGTGTPTLAAGSTILTGPAGFNAGILYLGTFTQLGNAAINLTFTGVGTGLNIARGSVIGGDITANVPEIFLSSTTFNGVTNFTKTGTGNDNSAGGNTFNGTCTLANSGAGYLLLGNTSPDIWNNDVTFTNSGSERILPCWATAGNQFNGNIYLNTSGSAQGIQFCGGNTVATATLAANKTIAAGTTGLNAGYLQLRQFTQLGTTAINLVLGSTATYLQYGPSSLFNGTITSSSPGLFFNSTTFNGMITCVKTGTTGDFSPGGNTFNGITTIVNSGSNFLVLGNTSPDIWNNDVTFTNNGSERLLPCWATAGNQFNGNIYVNTSGSAQGIQFCGGNATATATLAANKTIAAGTTGFNAGYLQLKQFTQLGTTAINLVLGSTATYLQYGPSSLFGGTITSSSPGLFFNGCTFNGLINCTKTGASTDNSTGNNNFNAAAIITNNGSGPLTFGSSNSDQFNAPATFNNTGSSNINVANNSPNTVFGGITTFNNSPSANGGIFVSSNSTGTIFNDNIVVTSTAGQGVQFCTGNANATATLAASKTISVGAVGFSAGTLLLRQFTQTGNTAQNFSLTGTGNLTFGPSSAFGGNITSVSPTILYNGCTFAGTVNAIKNGSTNDASTGNNTFNGDFTITNTGVGYFMMGNGNPDVWNANATFNNMSTAQNLYTAYSSTGTVFNGDVFYNNQPGATNIWIYPNNSGAATQYNGNISVSNVNGGGVYFGNGTGTATLAAGKTVSVGPLGFNYGALIFRNFTQAGITSQSIVTTGTSNIQFGPVATFGGDVASTSPGLFFNGCTFSRTTNCTKNGSTNDNSNGGNIFTGAAVINNSGAGNLVLSNTTSDQFLAQATFNNTGTGGVAPAYNAINNVFNGVVTLNNSPGATTGYINFAPYNTGTQLKNNLIINQTQGTTYIGYNLTAGNYVTQANGYSVNSGTVSGGDIYLYNFRQAGSTLSHASAIASSAPTAGNLYINNATFYDNFTASYPNIRNVQASTFNGTAAFTKTGGNNQDVWYGANTFNDVTSITNQATTASYYLYMANTAADSYNADVSFVQASIANIYPNNNSNCSYAGNITVTSPAANAITFGNAAGGIATFVNAAAQTISKGNGTTPNPNFSRLVMSKTSNTLTLNTRINITSYLTMNSGIISTTSVNLVNMNNAATTNIGNAGSYINGPMNYDMALNGSRTLNFPIGKAGDWRPGVLAVTHNNATSYTYVGELTNASAAALSWTLPTTVANVSLEHYWDFTRKNTATSVVTPTLDLSGTQTVTLYYDANDGVTDPTNLVICKNTYTASSTWINIGGTGASATTGSVASTSSPSTFNSFSRFTLGNKTSGNNPLPIELLSFTAVALDTKVRLDWATATEKNNEAYLIERSADGVHFEFVAKVMAKGDGNSAVKQSYSTFDEQPLNGISYYRLKQLDKNSGLKTFNMVVVEFGKYPAISLYPNPTTGRLYITAGEHYSSASVRVVSALGATVRAEAPLGSYADGIDLSGLEGGIYFMVIRNADAVETIKISLQK